MAKKEEKAKVGRPKLADLKTKKESIFVCIFILIVSIVIIILGYNILTIDFNPKYMVGTVYNDHVNSCIIEKNIIDCGPNVNFMKYKIDDGSYVEMYKKDESINNKVSDYKILEVCYTTRKTDLKCIKKTY